METKTGSLAKLGCLLRTQGLFIFTLLALATGCSSDKQNGRDYYSNNGAFRLVYPANECIINDNVCNGSQGGCNNNGCGTRSGCGSNMIEVSFNTQQELCNYIRMRIDSGRCNQWGTLTREFQRFQCNFMGWNNNGVNVGVDIGVGINNPQQPVILPQPVIPVQPPADWLRLFEEDLIRRTTGYYTLNGCIAHLNNTFDYIDVCMNNEPDLPIEPGLGEKDSPSVPEKDQLVVRRNEKDEIVVSNNAGDVKSVSPGPKPTQSPPPTKKPAVTTPPQTPGGGVVPRANLLDYNKVEFIAKGVGNNAWMIGGRSIPYVRISGTLDSGSPIYNLGYEAKENKEVELIKRNDVVLSDDDKNKLCPNLRGEVTTQGATIFITFMPDREKPENFGICGEFFSKFSESTSSLEFKFKTPLKIPNSTVTLDFPFKLIRM